MSKRKLVVSNIMSFDGYFEGPGNNPMALPMDGGFDSYNAKLLRSSSTLLLGRKTFEMFRGFWPMMADNPDATDTHREISKLNGEMDKVVVSDTLTAPTDGDWQNSTVVKRADVEKAITALKNEPGDDILVFGSHTMWNELLKLGLVDEIHMIVGATVLGGGTPAFDSGVTALLEPIGHETLSGSDNIVAKYSVKN